MLVDTVEEVVELYETDIDVAPNVGNEETSNYIQGVATRDGKLLIMLDLNKLLADDD